MRIGLIFLSWIVISPAFAEILEEIHWGMDIEENVPFANAETCNEVARSVLQENGFIPNKTGYYEQGPTIFSVNEDKTQKSVVKCMLAYNLLITAVIGMKENLQKAEQINNDIKNRQQQQNQPIPIGQQQNQPVPINQQENKQVEQNNQKKPFTYFGKQQTIPAPRGYMVLASPTLGADILNQVAQSGAVEVVGYVETAEGKFYISEYSWEQYKAGKDPNWIYISPK
jgi:hypothetical protein